MPSSHLWAALHPAAKSSARSSTLKKKKQQTYKDHSLATPLSIHGAPCPWTTPQPPWAPDPPTARPVWRLMHGEDMGFAQGLTENSGRAGAAPTWREPLSQASATKTSLLRTQAVLARGDQFCLKAATKAVPLRLVLASTSRGVVCCSPCKGHTHPALSQALWPCPCCALAQLAGHRNAKSCRILLGAVCHGVLLTTAHLPWQSDPHCSNL